MNRERAKELLPIIQAFADGKTIQYKSGPESWEDVTNKMYPSILEREYRIKPEPREFWIHRDLDQVLDENPAYGANLYIKVREVIE